MNQKRLLLTIMLTLGLLSAFSFGWVAAQEREPQTEPSSVISVDAKVRSSFNYQGVLRESGTPVSGDRDMTFTMYEDEACTIQVGVVMIHPDVSVTDGLFAVDLQVSSSNVDGKGLWLEVEVEGTAIGCQEILPVPYALSLRPGASIVGDRENWDVIHAHNTATTGLSFGVYGRSDSMHGVGGYFTNEFGAAIKAAGSGIIKSTADSHLWISGNDAQPQFQDDSTVIDLDSMGGAKIYRGAETGRKHIMLPITLPGPLYGQGVTLTGLDIFWLSSTGLESISAVIFRLQTGVNDYENIVFDNTTVNTCNDAVYPDGCTIHFDLSDNNIISQEAGILYLTLGLDFGSASDYLQLGGARLTLQHD